MNARVPLALALTTTMAAIGCAVAPGPPELDGPREVELSALLPAGAQPVGVAVSPEGKRYVLDRLSGLYELGSATATLVFKTSDLASRYGQPANLELTDVVALGSEQFAITAENDGFILDLHGGTFSSYFCYLPGDFPPTSTGVVPSSISQTLQAQGIEVKQRTQSVAFNALGQMLFAQPQTLRLDTGAVAGSELFSFGAGGGQPTRIQSMPDNAFVAGGMVVVSGQRLLLGGGHSIFEMTPTGALILVKELDASIQIDGMARYPDGQILLLDRARNRLLRIDAL